MPRESLDFIVKIQNQLSTGGMKPTEETISEELVTIN